MNFLTVEIINNWNKAPGTSRGQSICTFCSSAGNTLASLRSLLKCVLIKEAFLNASLQNTNRLPLIFFISYQHLSDTLHSVLFAFLSL